MLSIFRKHAIITALAFLCIAPYVHADNDSAEARLRKDVKILASDEYEGRGVGTKGLEKAAEYIAEQFKEAGLNPGGKNGTYFQPFTVTGQRKLKKDNVLVLHGPQGQKIELRQGKDFQVMGLSGGGKVTAPVVFAGYGVSAPKQNYDDFKNIDVKGKIVVVIRRLPRWSSKYASFAEKQKNILAPLVQKQSVPETQGAAAVLLINDRTEVKRGDQLLPFSGLRGGSGTVPSMHVRRSVFDDILRSSFGKSLTDIEEAIDRNLEPQSALLPGWKATVKSDVFATKHKVKNVIGVLEGSGPLADETIVIGAHYDHLGYGAYGSRAKDRNKKQIHNGADDNASGTAAAMELARRFADSKGPRRRLVFIAFSAEEMGLLGSQHYCNEEPLFDLNKTAAMVNLDMVGRMSKSDNGAIGRVIVQGVGTAKSFESLVDSINKKWNFQLAKKKSGTGPSDHDSFYRKNVPVLFFFTGTHKDYHRPSDDTEFIEFKGLTAITNMVEDVVQTLATGPRPEYVAGQSSASVSPGSFPTMGIRPDYASDKDGLLVEAVSPGGPADKGGMKAKDLIVEIAGKRIRNIQTYVTVMRLQKRGEAIPVAVIRDGKKVTLKVAPK